MIIAYTVLLYLLQPFILLRLWFRGRKIPAYRKRWAERYGFCNGKVVAGGIVLHSVSVGETLAAIPLVRALRRLYPKLPITVTTMTPTGSERAQSAFGKTVHHVYLPYDLPGAINRFLNAADPRLVIIMETELWPNLIDTLYHRSIPLVIANARLSQRSAKRYLKFTRFTRDMLQKITLVAAQSEEDGKHFMQLGLNQTQLVITGSLKFDITLTPELAAKAVALRHQWASHRPVWIAASTHEGEESIVLETHRRLLKQFPRLLLILAPRHPERFSVVHKLTLKQGFTAILRSSNKVPANDTQVVIGDTMGELMLLYGIADLAFVGGSLIKSGGHNPLEPAAHAIPVLMGPHIWNFKDICGKLHRAEGLIYVNESLSMEQEIANFLLDEDYRNYCGHHAADVLHQNQGALKRLLSLIETWLPPRNQ